MRGRLTDEGLDRIERYGHEYERWLTNGQPYREDELGDRAWWSIVAIPALVAELREYRRRAHQERKNGHDEGDYGDHQGGPSAPPLQFVQSKHVLPASRLPLSNPLAQFPVRLLAQLMRIFGFHGRKESHYPSIPASADLRVD